MLLIASGIKGLFKHLISFEKSAHHHILLAACRRTWCTAMAQICNLFKGFWDRTGDVCPQKSAVSH